MDNLNQVKLYHSSLNQILSLVDCSSLRQTFVQVELKQTRACEGAGRLPSPGLAKHFLCT